jgi:hypothetical protein
LTFPPRKPSRPYGLPTTPFDPRSGTFLPLADLGPFRELTILEVGHDALLCEDRHGTPRLVLRPWALRRSSFNGETFDVGGTDTAFASTGLDTRTATPDGGSAVTETVSPGYAIGEKIVAFYKPGTGPFGDEPGVGVVGAGELTDTNADSYLIPWEDVNTAGRKWGSPASAWIGATLEIASSQPVSWIPYSEVIAATTIGSNGVSVSGGRITIQTAGLYRLWCNLFGGGPDALDHYQMDGLFGVAGAAAYHVAQGVNEIGTGTPSAGLFLHGEDWQAFAAGDVVSFWAYMPNSGFASGTIVEGQWGIEFKKAS